MSKLLGYKGTTHYQAGYIYAQYIPLYTTPAIHLNKWFEYEFSRLYKFTDNERQIVDSATAYPPIPIIRRGNKIISYEHRPITNPNTKVMFLVKLHCGAMSEYIATDGVKFRINNICENNHLLRFMGINDHKVIVAAITKLCDELRSDNDIIE